MPLETWQGSAELTGYAAIVAQTYPIDVHRVVSETGERVDFTIAEPVLVPGPLDSSMYKQIIELRILADQARVEELATEMVHDTASAISFATNRRVQVFLNHISRASSEEAQDESSTMLFVRRFRGPQEPVTTDLDYFGYIGQQLTDDEDDRGRRITRALRWLRKASLADDEVEEFAALAMGYEAIKSLLPAPPEPVGGKKKKGKQQQPSKLTYWAVNKCGIAAGDWKRVWGFRNSLFHGGITENASTRSELAIAAPHIRLALVAALKHLLKVPDDAPPSLDLPPVVISGVSIMAPKFTPASGPSPGESRE